MQIPTGELEAHSDCPCTGWLTGLAERNILWYLRFRLSRYTISGLRIWERKVGQNALDPL